MLNLAWDVDLVWNQSQCWMGVQCCSLQITLLNDTSVHCIFMHKDTMNVIEIFNSLWGASSLYCCWSKRCYLLLGTWVAHVTQRVREKLVLTFASLWDFPRCPSELLERICPTASQAARFLLPKKHSPITQFSTHQSITERTNFIFNRSWILFKNPLGFLTSFFKIPDSLSSDCVKSPKDCFPKLWKLSD